METNSVLTLVLIAASIYMFYFSVRHFIAHVIFVKQLLSLSYCNNNSAKKDKDRGRHDTGAELQRLCHVFLGPCLF